MNTAKKASLSLLLIICNGCACALTLKAGIGVGAWDAMAQATSEITAVQVGTVGFIFNSLCVLGEWIILKKNFKFQHFLQMIISFLFGFVVNFMFYHVMVFPISHYFLRLSILIIGYVLMACFVGGLMSLGMVTFALEGFCRVLADQTHYSFARIRQAVDVLAIVVSLLLCSVFQVPLTIREGTVIGMLLYAPILNQAIQISSNIFKGKEKKNG